MLKRKTANILNSKKKGQAHKNHIRISIENEVAKGHHRRRQPNGAGGSEKVETASDVTDRESKKKKNTDGRESLKRSSLEGGRPKSRKKRPREQSGGPAVRW